MTIFTMDSLKEGSIRVYSGMITVFPQFGKEEQININELEQEYNNCYAINNSVICFVCNNEIFVTPYTGMAVQFLDFTGFHKESFYVPFSNGNYPKYEKLK